MLNGWGGALAGAFSVMLPGVLCTVALMALLSLLGESAIQYIEYGSVGITAYIVFLLVSFIGKVISTGDKRINLLICTAAFAVTGGKEVRQIIAGILERQATAAVLDISTISLMILSFFLIFLISLTKEKALLWSGCLLAAVYCFASGKWAAANLPAGFSAVTAIILVIQLLTVLLMGRGKMGKRMNLTIPPIAVATVAAFVLVIAVSFAAGALAVGWESVGFLSNVGVSTLTSFGGGEAYVSVADGIFVQAGFADSDVFYSRLIPVANALPGPILVKLASGIAYLYGGGLSGIVLALCTACVASSVCSLIAVFLYAIYDSVKEFKIILSLKSYILPVICGMLISTSLSMFAEAMHVMGERAIPGPLGIIMLVAGVAVLFLISRKRHINDPILLISAAAISIVGLLLKQL